MLEWNMTGAYVRETARTYRHLMLVVVWHLTVCVCNKCMLTAWARFFIFKTLSVWSELQMAPTAFFIAGGACIISSRPWRKTQIFPCRRSGGSVENPIHPTRTSQWQLRKSYKSSRRLLTPRIRLKVILRKQHFSAAQSNSANKSTFLPFKQNTHIWWLEIKAEIIKNM